MRRVGCIVLSLAAAPAQACGALSAHALLQSVAPSGEITLDPGGPARLAGLALDARALAALRARVGQSFGVATLTQNPDRWGRHSVDLFENDGRSATLGWVEQGFARVRPEPETRGCQSERLEAEAAARAAREGLWSAPGAVIEAGDLNALRAAGGRFVLAQGRVRRVGASRSRFYLDFEPANGLSALISRKAEPQFRRAGVAVMDLAGQKVLVRGVLDDRFGPRIEIADPAMIELLENGRESSRGG